eukprot:scaffold25176_cov191-Cylindrotheca_fusiformis.AAC.2
MPAPLGLREAIDISEKTASSSSSSSSSSLVDILAVVLSVIKSPSIPPASSKCKAEVCITDECLAPDESVFVTLWGSSALSRLEQERISNGDIIRFNRVGLRKKGKRSKAYCFVHSLEDPESGLAWFRLSSKKGAIHFPVPENMKVAPERIEELKRFHQSSGNGRSLLPPLRCRRRSLSELQASAGMLSHITIVVKSHDVQQSSPQALGKRRRSSPMPQATMGYARVADALTPEGTMTLVDLDNRFSGTLRSAKATGQVLMFTNVSSRKQSDIQGKNCAVDEIILVPTQASVVLLISEEGKKQGGGTQTLLDGTQVENSSYGEIEVISSIFDFSIGGMALQETRCMESPSSFLQNMTTTDGKYREISVHLESFGTASAQPTYSIFASSKVTQTLCGGIEPEELIQDEGLRVRSFKLVHALLREQVLLRWTIDTSFSPPKVLKVVLPHS